MAHYRKSNREYRVTLSNGKTLKIVAVSAQKAYARAERFAKTQEGNVIVRSFNEIED